MGDQRHDYGGRRQRISAQEQAAHRLGEIQAQEQENDQPGNQYRAFEEAEIEAAIQVDRLGNEQAVARSEEHTSELQSRPHLVCRLLLEKKKTMILARS